MIDIEKDVLDSFINPKEEKASVWRRLSKPQEHKLDLMKRRDNYVVITDYLKSKHWHEVQRPRIIEALRSGLGKLLRDGLTMSDTDTKVIIQEMRSNLEIIADMRYAVESGLKAMEELRKYEIKDSKRGL